MFLVNHADWKIKKIKNFMIELAYTSVIHKFLVFVKVDVNVEGSVKRDEQAGKGVEQFYK